MEMKQIPDYPNYAVTRDGRVWSYNVNRFMKLQKSQWGTKVALNVEGIKITKYVRRLVYCVFNNCKDVDCITHKDGDKYNNNLDNLVARTRHQHACYTNSNRYLSKSLKNKKVVKIDISTRKIEQVNLSIYTGAKYKEEYKKILNAISPIYKGGSITRDDALYFVEGEKYQLINKIQSCIKTDEILLRNIDIYNVFKKSIRKKIKVNKNYLQILEKI